MNLPRIARESHDRVYATRLPALRALAEATPLNRIEWNDRSLGVVVHGITDLYLREVLDALPVRPSILSLGMTNPVPGEMLRAFASGVDGKVVVLGDGMRFVQEECLALGLAVEGKDPLDPSTEWTPAAIARRLGAEIQEPPAPSLAPIPRPPNICAGCPYRAFGLVVAKLRKKKRIVGSFGDIGCNTLLFFLRAIDTCTCMGASETERQGVVLSDPSMAGRVLSVLGDSTECHSGLDATRNAVFRNVPGVKVILDNATTAMTGGQPAPSSPRNLAGEETRFDLVAAARGEGAEVVALDAYDMAAIESGLAAALDRAAEGSFTVLVIRGKCMREAPSEEKRPRYRTTPEVCKQCHRCQICPGIETDEDGYPRFTHLCTGCGGEQAICVQRCVRGGLVPVEEADEEPAPPPLPEIPEVEESGEAVELPSVIRVAVRGVGGQGNLFLGKVLAEVALRLGATNVVKGETHGMAQLGGPVISTFGWGDVHSPVPAPASADALVVLEPTELLRPGFLAMLRPGGTVLLNRNALVPAAVDPADYPSIDAIRGVLADHETIEFDALGESRAMGDEQGRFSNVIALGLLSTVEPFSRVPLATWRDALFAVSPSDFVRRANLASFLRGRELRYR
jgi:indolepyruvate ferredoxin oxidoreductase alpha subunit